MKIPFVGPTYQSRSRDVNYQVCRNYYLESDPTGKNLVALYPTPGLLRKTFSGSGPNRGNGIVFLSNAYFLINNTLWKFNGSTLTSSGTIGSISGRIAMSQNGTQLTIVDGTATGTIWDGTTLTAIADVDFPTATHVDYMDGYTIVNKVDTGRFHISALNDSSAWTSTDFGTAIRNPDNLTALAVNHRELWLFGPLTAEVWYNSGNADFPFEPIQGGFIEWGIAAPYSVAKFDNNLIWLAQTENGGPFVVQSNGFTPTIVSTPPLNFEFSNYGTIANAEAFTYKKGGHEFYELTFPTENKTWLYDALTKQWTELTGSVGRHRINGIVYFNNEHWCGDYASSHVYNLDFDTYNEVLVPATTATLSRSSGTVTATVTAHEFITGDDVTIRGANQAAYNGTFTVANVAANTFDYYIDTAPATPATGSVTASLEKHVVRARSCQHLHKDQRRVFHHSLQVDFESGVGAVTGQGVDPTAMLRWSDDGGFTWSNNHHATIGALGNYATRAIWRRLGSARDRLYEVSISDPVKAVIIGADLNLSMGDS